MFFEIDTGNGVPVYEQVVRQITFAVANGSLASGEMIPSVRQTARELAINPNTVSRAFRELHDRGILEQVRGTGMAVTSGARTICRSERTRVLRDRFAAVIDEAAQTMLDRDEILRIFESELDRNRAINKG
jgi:GntR family transcriptional regulator